MTIYTLYNQVTPSGVSYGSATGTFGTIFTLGKSASLTAIWYYSGPSEAALPTECGIWDVASQAIVAGTDNNAPSWSGAAGSGWVKCAYNGSVVLDTRADGYITTVQFSGNKGYNTVAFPFTSGIITAPAADVYSVTNAPYTLAGTFSFPSTSGGGLNWGADVEVTTAQPLYTAYMASM